MISKGFMYVWDPDEWDRAKRIGIDGKTIFDIVSDDYRIDLMSADEHTDTIVVVLKRKEEEDEEI